MASKEGDEMRTRVEKTAVIFRDQKLHHQYVDEFVEYLKNGKLDFSKILGNWSNSKLNDICNGVLKS
ncbi:hypothetical protein ACSBR1_005006 [Camellia fascicularis]